MQEVNDFLTEKTRSSFQDFLIPKVLIHNKAFENLSMKAIYLYCVFLNKVIYSEKDNFADEQGYLFVVCTTKEILEMLNCSQEKMEKCYAELSEFGLIKNEPEQDGKYKVYLRDYTKFVT